MRRTSVASLAAGPVVDGRHAPREPCYEMSARYRSRGPATLLYDPECGLCRATAAWLGRRVPASALRLMALTDASNDPGLADKVMGRDLMAMLHLVDRDGTVATGARAVLAAGRLVPRWRLLAAAFDHRPGLIVLDRVYRWIAGHRRQVSRLLRLPSSCPVPSPADRPRQGDRAEQTFAG
jgi:predicted DCC family thiol-disulfide oxidoreductase YuxK